MGHGIRRWGLDYLHFLGDDILDFIAEYQWYFFASGAAFCMLCAALAAGLTMGYMSIDKVRLEVMLDANLDDRSISMKESERENARLDQTFARKISPLMSWRHRL